MPISAYAYLLAHMRAQRTHSKERNKVRVNPMYSECVSASGAPYFIEERERMQIGETLSIWKWSN